jgi:hypothetical protein
MKGSYTIRSSESRWPRVMRWRPARAQRSVDRGASRPAIEPRKTKSGVPTRCLTSEGNTGGGVFASRQRAPRGRRTWHGCDLSMFENRESPFLSVLVDDAPPYMGRGVACWRVAGRAGNTQVVIP